MIYCSPSTQTEHSFAALLQNSGPKLTDWYRSALRGSFGTGPHRKKNNLHDFVLFINWNWVIFYFENLLDSLCYIRLWLIIDTRLLLYLENNSFHACDILFNVYLSTTP